MSGNSGGQGEAYIRSLKQIKEQEDKVQAEIDAHRAQVEQEMKALDEELAKATADAKAEGERVVQESVEAARQKARLEADRIIADASSKAKSISGHLDPQTTTEPIIEILLSGI